MFYIEDKDKLPKQVRYAIRLSSESSWETGSTYPAYQPDNPSDG